MNIIDYSFKKIITIHFGIGLIFPFIMEGLSYLYLLPSPESESLIEVVFAAFHWKIIEHNISFYVFVAVLYTYQYIKILREQKLLSDNLELQVKQAELKALKYQLNPHFLFNSLNSINAFILENPKSAQSMLLKLSDFLRYSLEIKDKKFLSLEMELEQIKRFMEIEKIRFEERVNFKLENNIRSKCLIPTLMLQPLIENCFKHGVGKSSDICNIILSLNENNENINISIYNDTVDSSFAGGTKVGLENTVKRLEMNFNKNFSFEIDESKGFEVKITIPKLSDNENEYINR